MCPTHCNPMDNSPSGIPVHGISQARILDGLPFPSPGIFLTQGLNRSLLHASGIEVHKIKPPPHYCQVVTTINSLMPTLRNCKLYIHINVYIHTHTWFFIYPNTIILYILLLLFYWRVYSYQVGQIVQKNTNELRDQPNTCRSV